jgi:hypothetical protein
LFYEFVKVRAIPENYVSKRHCQEQLSLFIPEIRGDILTGCIKGRLYETEIKSSAKSKKFLLKLLGIREAIVYPVCSTHKLTLNPQI